MVVVVLVTVIVMITVVFLVFVNIVVTVVDSRALLYYALTFQDFLGLALS